MNPMNPMNPYYWSIRGFDLDKPIKEITLDDAKILMRFILCYNDEFRRFNERYPGYFPLIPNSPYLKQVIIDRAITKETFLTLLESFS